MTPRFSKSSAAHRHEGDTESIGKLLQWCWGGTRSLMANGADAIIGEFGEVLAGPVGLAASLLLIHVGHVVPVIPKEEMIWVHTASVVAAVEDEYPFMDGAVGQCPRDSVRYGNGIPLSVFDRRGTYDTVAVAPPPRVHPTDVAHPLDERTIPVDVIPEPVFVGLPRGFCRTSLGSHARKCTTTIGKDG